ncbi:uncharacterized protein LOC126895332 isoform X4 [Daktulosphaira vitifoliae]|uniref:uncharacterized protein LOC126895332 isoform X4 n=1 Tax=Daktulosphaira vitifoliae TaxID=58002 RepID=UPI0021A982F3|nr:uncharacterized protein LOC126895332 isoform X4 [Daktulosphaira vitifoliae]
MKMAIILNIQVYLCMFFAVLDIEGLHNKKEKAAIINDFLLQPGWKSINDVEFINYWRQKYVLKNLFIEPVTLYNCDNYIRQATIFLGCSYYHDLKLIFLSLIKLQEQCLHLLHSCDDSAHNCTVTLLTKMIEIVPMAKFMKGALYAIEKYHNSPLNTLTRTRFILSSLLTNIQEDESLLTTLRISSDSIRDVLETIAKILFARRLELDEEKLFCQLKYLDFNSLCNLWNMEFNNLKYQGKYHEFFIFLSDKIKNLILTTIRKKYIELGFKYDSSTSETFLLGLPPTNVKEDIAQKFTINFVQNTNEVNPQEENKQHDIAQKFTINFVQNTNEVNAQEENQQHDLTKYPSILHTNDVENKEGIQQEKNAVIINDFLRQPGWKNINDVEFINYWRQKYEPRDLFIERVTLYNCDNYIRQATIFLGCSYYHDLKLIFLSLIKLQEHCLHLLNSCDDSAHNCTVTLLTKMFEIIPMAKFMKGALYAIEKYHNSPLNTLTRTRFILSSLLTNIQEDESLLTTLRISSDSTRDVLETIAKILFARRLELDEEKLFCQLKYLDFNSLCNIWNMEFNDLRYRGKYQEFFIFLSDKIKNLILTTIRKKYIELGFKYDSSTSETFLLGLPPTNVKEDIAQKFTINFVQNTNEVNPQEENQHYDLTKYPSILHTNDVVNKEGIQQENGTFTKKENAVIINDFLRQPGWNNINDVELIKNCGKNYELKNLFIEPVTIHNCDNFIRQATIFLGCSYYHDLNLMFLSLIKFQQHCSDLLYSGNDSVYNCTVTLLTKIIEMVPLAKYMKGALYAIEKYHIRPLNTLKKTRFILSSILSKIQKDETLLTVLKNKSDSISEILMTIAKLLYARRFKLDRNKSFCVLKQLDFNSLWNSWNIEFNTLFYEGKYQELFIFLSDKIRKLNITIIRKKYIELGFKYDSSTSQTFLLALPSTNVKEDIAQKFTINFVQNTNEVNAQEENQHFDLTKYPSILHTNDVVNKEGIQQERKHSKKENATIINNFLRQPGWSNINDVELIKYCGKNYELKNLFIEPVTIHNCDNFIRQATIFLGCSYYHDLKLIFLSLIKLQEHCSDLLNSGNDSTYNCTVTLLIKMVEIVPMAKYMKGALYAIEKYHINPLNLQKKIRFILSSILTKIQKDETLLTTLKISSDSIRDVLVTIAKILSARSLELDENNSFCLLKQIDFNSLWNLWNIELNTLIYEGKYQKLFIFLSDKIRNLILTTIRKKYIELGFKFDYYTSQTILPGLRPTDFKQGIDQNFTINFIQNPNEVNAQEEIQHYDLTKYPSLLHTNVVEKKEGIQQENVNCDFRDDSVLLIEYPEDITKYPSIPYTNNVEKQEDIRQENVNCELKDDSAVLIEYPKGMEPFNKYL